MKRYETYKDSGAEWIGDIPNHWGTVKIKYLNNQDDTIFIDGDWIESKVIEDTGIRYLTTGNIGPGYYKEQGRGFISEYTFEDLNCTEVFPGDLVMSRLNKPIGRACIIPNLGHRIIVAVDNVILRPNQNFERQFLLHVMNSDGYSTYTDLISRGATMQRISRGQLGNINIPAPSLQEQTQIAAYLDYKTGLIDTIIAQKEDLIKKLKEQRQAIINEAVTKGLNKDVKLKDSGIEWLGDIPEHWEVKKLKYEFDNLNNIRVPLSSSERGIMKIKKYDYYGASGVIDKVEDYLFDGENILIGEDGANLLTRSKRLAFIAEGKYWVNNHAHIISPKSGNINYMAELLELIDYTPLIVGSAQPKLTQDALINISIPVPPVKEQNLIMEHLDIIMSNNNRTANLLSKQVKKLKEYRQSLISEAVTGKIDVRDWQAPKS